MPTPELNRKIVDALRQLDQMTQAMGLGPMTPEELRHAHERIYTGVAGVLQARQGQGDRVVGQSPTSEPAQNLLMRGPTPPPVVDTMRPGLLNRGFHVPGRPYDQLRTT